MGKFSVEISINDYPERAKSAYENGLLADNSFIYYDCEAGFCAWPTWSASLAWNDDNNHRLGKSLFPLGTVADIFGDFSDREAAVKKILLAVKKGKIESEKFIFANGKEGEEKRRFFFVFTRRFTEEEGYGTLCEWTYRAGEEREYGEADFTGNFEDSGELKSFAVEQIKKYGENIEDFTQKLD